MADANTCRSGEVISAHDRPVKKLGFGAIGILSCAALLIGCAVPLKQVDLGAPNPRCQPPVNAAPEAVRWDEGRHLCYLGALSENLNRLTTATDDDRDTILGDIAVYLAMLGEDEASRKVVAAAAGAPSAPRASAPPDLSGILGRQAREEILQRAALTRTLVINEAHHVPRHRDFLRRLLPALRKLGFTHLAAEGLAFDLDTSAASTSGPDHSFGFYVRDPAFARLLYDARSLGFTIVPYEAPPQEPTSDRVGSMQVREMNQATTLFNRSLKGAPKARLIVLVGYDHLEEVPRRRSDGKGEFYWMAAELKRLSGIDPLTVDQTTFNPEGSPGLEAPAYRALLAQTSATGSVVLFHGAQPTVLGRYKGRVDLQVLHPPAPLLHGRERWRWEGMRVIWPKLPTTPEGSRVYVAQAMHRADGGSVPLDQTVTSWTAPAPLLVPPSVDVEVLLTPLPTSLAEAIRDAREGGACELSAKRLGAKSWAALASAAGSDLLHRCRR